MLPPLDARGLLPDGEHEATWGEIESVFCWNDYRAQLLADVQRFVRIELAPVAAGLRLVLGGSFLTDKPIPADIEGVLYLPIQGIDHQRMADIARLGVEQEHNRIKAAYRFDFYITPMIPGINDLGLYFRYAGPKTAAAKGIHEKDVRGIVRVTQWTPG